MAGAGLVYPCYLTWLWTLLHLTAFVTDVLQMCGVRFVLGIFEAGIMPGIAYYMSRWYRRAELTFRLSLYIVMSPLAGAFGGLLVSGILKLDALGTLHSWQMIFGMSSGLMCVGKAELIWTMLIRLCEQ